MTRQSVMDAVEKSTKVYSIKIIGNQKDKDDAFYVLMNTQQLCSDKKNVYHGLSSTTLLLLEEAEIKFEVLK